MKKIILSLIIVMVAALAFAAAPVVSNVSATPAAGQVTVTYNLSADGPCTVSLLVSSDNGSSYMNTHLTAVSGAIGNSVSAGTGKQIIWHPAGDEMELGASYKVKVIARDNPSPTAADDFIFVKGGTFSNGTSDVSLSSFYIDKYEITQAEYQAVMGVNPSYFTGVTNGPVERVSWFNAIEYCNRRSMQEGFTACYSYNDGTEYGANPANWPSGWNTNRDNHINVSCSWVANGYRLPTEMEWMFAAKGGNPSQGYTYSGSNTIGDVAWYESNSGSTTHTVGTKAANELGTFDMSGNVWEWCWDIYGTYPGGSQTDPHGATSGSHRVFRGGSWFYSADDCPVSYRDGSFATDGSNGGGFRCVRVSP